MEHNASLSLLPPAGGNIMAMRGGAVMQGGNVPVGYNQDASLIQLPPTANHIPIVDMKGGDETLPMAAAATVALAPAAEGDKKIALKSKAVSKKAIRFILFDEEFNAFSPDTVNHPILNRLDKLNPANSQVAQQQIYDGILNLSRSTVLTDYPQFKQLLINMAIEYAKKKENLEDIERPELTEIALAFPSGKVVVTLTIKCDQRPSCIQKNLSMAAAATAMLQKGGADIQLFGETYTFDTLPQSTNYPSHKKLLDELKANEKTDSRFNDVFQVALLQEIYNGCITDGAIISKPGCEHFGLLLEKLGEIYANEMREMMARKTSSKKNGETSRKELANGDLVFTFTFLKFGKQISEETLKKINAVVQKSSNAQSFGSKLKHMVSTVSSDQVSTHGMINRNNACFCISVLQFLFSIPQIRTAVKKHGCDSEVFAQILDPDHKITTVNNDGIMCALFNLFEELGENIKTFSTVTSADLNANAVPYELLGYIMKNFEVDRKDTANPYTIGRQEDADTFLTFLFGIFEENKIPIEHLFQFTIKSTIGKDSDAMSWPLGLARDTGGNILLTDGMPKQVFSIEGSTSVEVGRNTEKTTEIKKDTITLKKNPYVLMKTSVNAIGDIVTDASGSISQPRYNNIDLTAITPELTIDGKKFKLFGSIQYNGYSVPVNSKDSSKGTNTAGHYIYTRRDLASKKGIIYNDSTLTLDDDIGKGSNQFPHYLLVYAEIGQEEKEADFEEKAKKRKEEILKENEPLLKRIHDDITGESDTALYGDFGEFLGTVKTDASASASGGGGSTLLFDKIFKEFPAKLSSYAKRKRNPRTEPATQDEDVIEVMSDEMKKAKASYMASAKNNEKEEALVTYATFSILKDLMEDITPISNNALQPKEVIAASKEKAATAAKFKEDHHLNEEAKAKVAPISAEIAAAAAMSSESDASSEEVLSAESETSEEDRQRQMAANEKRQQENKIGIKGPHAELTSLPNSPLSSKSLLAAKKEQAASLLASMRTLSDEIKQLKQDPNQNSDKIREKIFELTAIRSNVNDIQGINKSNSTNAATILSEAMKAKQPTLPKPVNAANAELVSPPPPSPSRSVSPPANIGRSASLVNKTRAASAKKAENAKVAKAEREERQKLYQAERNATQAKQDAAKQSTASSSAVASSPPVEKQQLSDTIVGKITELYNAAHTLKDKTINSSHVNTIKSQFGINESEMDKRNIMNALSKMAKKWMKSINESDIDNSDPTYVSTYLDYIALLVTKSKIDAQMASDKKIYSRNTLSAKLIAQRLIDKYSKMQNSQKLPIEQMAEHIIERQYYKQLESESNQLQDTSTRLQILNDAEQSKVAEQAMVNVNEHKKQIDEYRQELQDLKDTIKSGQQNVKTEAIQELHKIEMALMKEYVLQLQILKDAIKKIGKNPASADLSAELDVILGRLQEIYLYDRDLKKTTYKIIAKDELELYKEGEVLRDKARFYMGLEEQKPEGTSVEEAKKRAQAMSSELYKGGRRTLRATKKKRTLRAAKRTIRAKKRTLRASKKLRRSTPSK